MRCAQIPAGAFSSFFATRSLALALHLLLILYLPPRSLRRAKPYSLYCTQLVRKLVPIAGHDKGLPFVDDLFLPAGRPILAAELVAKKR